MWSLYRGRYSQCLDSSAELDSSVIRKQLLQEPQVWRLKDCTLSFSRLCCTEVTACSEVSLRRNHGLAASHPWFKPETLAAGSEGSFFFDVMSPWVALQYKWSVRVGKNKADFFTWCFSLLRTCSLVHLSCSIPHELGLFLKNITKIRTQFEYHAFVWKISE